MGGAECETRFIDEAGTPMVLISVTKNRSFASAVLRAWQRHDGIDRRDRLGWKAFRVPAAVFDGGVGSEARLRLAQRDGKPAGVAE